MSRGVLLLLLRLLSHQCGVSVASTSSRHGRRLGASYSPSGCSSSSYTGLCTISCNGEDECKDDSFTRSSGHGVTVFHCSGKAACSGNTNINCADPSKCYVTCDGEGTCKDANINGANRCCINGACSPIEDAGPSLLPPCYTSASDVPGANPSPSPSPAAARPTVASRRQEERSHGDDATTEWRHVSYDDVDGQERPRRRLDEGDTSPSCDPTATLFSMVDPCSSGQPTHNNLQGKGPLARASEPEEIRCALVPRAAARSPREALRVLRVCRSASRRPPAGFEKPARSAPWLRPGAKPLGSAPQVLRRGRLRGRGVRPGRHVQCVHAVREPVPGRTLHERVDGRYRLQRSVRNHRHRFWQHGRRRPTARACGDGARAASPRPRIGPTPRPFAPRAPTLCFSHR